jgi:hypothetical protein
MELVELVVPLEDGLLREKFEHDTPRTLVRFVKDETEKRTHPALHMSTSAPYTVAPKRSSGGRYQSVMTLFV